MRTPTIFIILIISCTFYFVSIGTGFAISFAEHHISHNMSTGCFKNCSKCHFVNDDSLCVTLFCYADVSSLFGMCAIVGTPISLVTLPFCALIWVMVSRTLGCISHGKRLGGAIINDKHVMIDCCDKVIDCDCNNVCCLVIECV